MDIGEPKNREVFNALAQVPDGWQFYNQRTSELCLVNDDSTIEIHIRNFTIRYPEEILSLYEPPNEEPEWN